GCWHIGIADRRRQRVSAVTLACQTRESPMDRHADDVRRLPIHYHWTDALRHVSLAHHHPTLRGHAHPAGLSNALRLGKRLADLDEFLRLQDRIDQRMLGPEVEMFRKPVSRGDIR